MSYPFSASNRLLEANDLYQEMTFYLWEKFKDGVPAYINRSYIIQGCKYHILNYLRKKRNKVFLMSIDEPINERGDTLKDILPASKKNPKKDIDTELTTEQILDGGLTEREKEVFLLLLEGYTLREAGKKLGISHVRVIHYRRKIRDRWEKTIQGYQTSGKDI